MLGCLGLGSSTPQQLCNLGKSSNILSLNVSICKLDVVHHPSRHLFQGLLAFHV